MLLALVQRGTALAQTAPVGIESWRPGLVQRDGAWWFEDRNGQPFFSRGVCCVSPGVSREEYDPQNPAYAAAWRQHESPQAWVRSALSRMRTWGFSTLGAWADLGVLRAATNQTLWLTPVLHLGSSVGAPWYDMWDEKLLQRLDQLARDQITAVRDDPRLLGYYSDNELGWWNAALFKMTLQQPAGSRQRQQLIRLLRTRYGDDWSRLTQDFEADQSEGWADLEEHGVLHLRPGGKGLPVLREFLSLLARRYYQLMHDTIRRYDARALILGDRYQSFYYPEVAREAADYVDVISSNLNAQWEDGTFLRCYLETLNGLTQKPMIISEFYMAAADNRSGNRNDQGVFPVAQTQAARARAAARTLERVAQYPFVIGADWFQWADEPRLGRTDGENFNFGLVDLDDRPYDELTGALGAVSIQPGARRTAPMPDARGGIPPAPTDPWAGFEPGRALLHWDRVRGLVPASSPFPLADLYACWDANHLYLGVYSLDIVEDAFYRDRNIPKTARALWTVSVNGSDPVQARIGAGRQPMVSDPEIRVENLSGWNLNVRNIALMALPARQRGGQPYHAGQQIELACTLTTHGGAETIAWRGSFTLVE
ncbi:MAG: hypothetical protein KIT22_09060 [Verrucomicrobiae bacterium]|nr:hypothetical protein [Verrucomicrobiae bacterium]